MWFLGFAEQDPPPAPTGEPHPDHGLSDEPSVSDEMNAVIVGVLPWVISLVFHAALVILAIFIVWSTVADQSEEEVIIPIARLSATPGAPVTQTQQKKVSKKSSMSARRSLSQSQSTSESTLTSKSNTQSSLVGVSGASGAKSSAFSKAARSASGMKATFFGTGGNARRLAYLVDASGSMIETLPFVILELKRSIGELSEKQEFTVIFFQEDNAIEVPTPNKGMKRANTQNKQKVINWIDISNGNVVPRGKSSPIEALRLALRYRPQLLFVLSDDITGQGRYEVDQRNLLADIRSNNQVGTKINTIQFLYEDKLAEAIGLDGKPLGEEGRTLYKISEMTGAIHKFLDARELGIK